MMPDDATGLFKPLDLPCGVRLKNRIAKASMSDSLGDGTGHPSVAQNRLYARWAQGGAAVSIIGEVQGSPGFAEKPGNLVLNEAADLDRFRGLAQAGTLNGSQLWMQLGHAGAMAFPPTSAPKGPSALDLPGLLCEALTPQEIAALPGEFATTARLAQAAGFGGVQVHAAHGFLLSQFLSPLFNRRDDAYGGDIAGRARLVLEVVDAVRRAVGPSFPVAIKINATDQLDGGLVEDEALAVLAMLDRTGIDLIDISGGTYFPGAKSASDSGGGGPYFTDFALRARTVISKPLMVTGGFKTRAQAVAALASGAADVVGLARALIIAPDLPSRWQQDQVSEPAFPRFTDPPEGGITAWYTMGLTAIGEDAAGPDPDDLPAAIAAYEDRDSARAAAWREHFGPAA